MFRAIIPISRFRENCDKALNSILATRHLFESIIIISKHIDPAYDKGKFADLPIKVVTRQPKRVKEDVFDGITLRIHPYVSFDEADLKRYKYMIQKSPVEHVFFAIRANYVLPANWYAPFILLALIWAYIQETFERGKQYQHTDLRGVVTVKKGRELLKTPKRAWWWRFKNPYKHPSEYSDTVAIQPHHTCKNYAREYLQTNRYLGWGLWMFFYGFYYVAYWLLIFATFQNLFPWPLFLAGWGLTWCLCQIILDARVKLTYKWFYVALLPIYYLFFPFYLTYARWFTPKEKW